MFSLIVLDNIVLDCASGLCCKIYSVGFRQADLHLGEYYKVLRELWVGVRQSHACDPPKFDKLH